MDGFWQSRCLDEHIDLFYMTGSFASGTNAFLVAKNWTKKIILLLLIKSIPVDRFQCLRCLNNRINLPYMMGSLTSGATYSLVAKIKTKYFATSCLVCRFWTNWRILIFKVSKRPYRSPPHDRITCKQHHFLPGGQKLNKKIISAVWRATGLKFGI